MIRSIRPFPILAAVVIASSLPALAQEPPSHGGSMTTVEGIRFETVFHRDQVLIYAWDHEARPIDPRGATGSLVVSPRDGSTPRRAELQPVAGPGGSAGYLRGRIDLSRIEDGAAEAAVEVHGLGGGGRHFAYRTESRLARVVEYVCPMKDSPPQAAPGRCRKCGMELERETAIYACPMHPGVTSRRAGDSCWICRMRLERRPDRDPGAGGHGGGHGGHGH